MFRLKFSYPLISLLLLSCSTEKINLSPVGDSITDSNGNITSYSPTERKNLIFYSSQISSLIASFPKFKNDAVNGEVAHLKFYLKDYIGAMEDYNGKGLNNAQKNFEKSYKKLQKFRQFLNKDEDEVLNRYLVRLKINMSKLESNIPSDSLIIPK